MNTVTKVDSDPKERVNKKVVRTTSTTISLVIVYIVICVVFSVLSPFFLTVKNFLNIGIYGSIIGVMGAGVTVAMLLGAIDLSQYSVATLSGIAAAMLLQSGFPLPIAILCCLLIGSFGGAINGILVSVFKIPAIIVTLGTMQIFRGIAYLSTGGVTVMIDNKAFDVIGKGYVAGFLPVPVLIVVAVFLLAFYMLTYTPFGRKVFAVGGNEKASYLSGVGIVGIKLGALILCGISSALSGLILTSQVGAAIPSTGVGSEMGVLAAVILGGISLSGGKGRISGTVIGILILATIQNGLTMLSVKSFYQMIINGVVLILAVLLDVVRSGALKKQ